MNTCSKDSRLRGSPEGDLLEKITQAFTEHDLKAFTRAAADYEERAPPHHKDWYVKHLTMVNNTMRTAGGGAVAGGGPAVPGGGVVAPGGDRDDGDLS